MCLPKAAVASVDNANTMYKTLSNLSVTKVQSALFSSGRFESIKDADFEKFAAVRTQIDDRIEGYIQQAKNTDADVLMLTSVYMKGGFYYGEVVTKPLDNRFVILDSAIRVKSRLVDNIPLLLEKEMYAFLEKLPVFFDTIEANADNTALISAGTFSKLKANRSYQLKTGGTVTVLSAGRYASFVRFNGSVPEEGALLDYPNVDDEYLYAEQQIEENIIRKYGAGYAYAKGMDPNKRYMESLAVINPFGNIVLPGFGSYLATSYMDIENTKQNYWNIGYTASSYLFCLLYVPGKNNFKVNFFPWIDGDKSDHDVRMHQFLWATIPFTFTVSYLDHMAIAYERNRIVPPGIDNEAVPLLHAIFIPGGGFFYYGRRTEGWLYYGAEMGVAYYCVDNYDNEQGKNALYLLAGVKIIDIVHSLILGSSYSYYNDERSSKNTTRFTGFVDENPDGTRSFKAGIGIDF